MKQLFIAGNWKSNKTILEAQKWLQEWNIQFPISNIQLKDITIVLCVPFTLLYMLKQEVDRLHLPIQLGAQDLSPFTDGAYTGEVSGRQIKELADWVIIGHSERRQYLHEGDEELSFEVLQAKSADLHVLYCVPDHISHIPLEVDVIAYEPIGAIGSGKSGNPERVNDMIASMKQNANVPMGLYGGSVSAENVLSFTQQPSIDGVLVGGASLDPEKFVNLINNAVSVYS